MGAGANVAPRAVQSKRSAVEAGPTTVTSWPRATSAPASARTCRPIPPVVGPTTRPTRRSTRSGSGIDGSAAKEDLHRRPVEEGGHGKEPADADEGHQRGDGDARGGGGTRPPRRQPPPPPPPHHRRGPP